MKIAVAILAALAVYLFVIYQLQINNAFTASLAVRADTSRTFALPPNDTITVMIPVTNNSWKSVDVVGASATCNILRVEHPERLDKKLGYWIIGTLVTPAETGWYADAMVLRTTGRDTFYGADVRYEVSTAAAAQDTIWLGHDRRVNLIGPDGDHRM